MNDQAIEYLDFNRKIVIELDTNNLVNEAIRRYELLKKIVLEKHSKKLLTPEAHFNTNEIEYLQVTLSWFNGYHGLDFEVLDGKSSSFVYYVDSREVPYRQVDKWFDLDKDCLDWLIDKLLLFTE